MPQYSGMWTLSQVSQAVKNQTWTGLPPSVVEYLIVAGGGAASTITYGYCGGSGAGGLLAGYAGITSGSSYFVTVGAGGAAGANGGNSVFDSTTSGASTGRIVASGGGRAADALDGFSGGSGGGGASSNLTYPGGAGIFGQGNAAGKNDINAAGYATGGGGGAGTVGLNAGSSIGGNGGAGIASAISGTVTTYAGGGGGGTRSGTAGSGGVGGGGAGSVGSVTGTAGTPNTGGGAGGTGAYATGAAGGSGIVIIRYPGTTQFFTGGTLSYANGYISHTFYANGTLVPIAGTLYANPDYQIARSLRFNSADSAYLSRTPGSATNRTTWTWSGWVKRASFGSSQVLFGAGPDASNYTIFYFSGTVSENLEIYNYTSGVNDGYVYTTSVFRDPSAWYHIVLAVDTTQATSADRTKIYVNGVLQPITISVTFASSLNTWVNTNNNHRLGSTPATGALYGGYMTDVNFIDGVALTPSSFGWTNPATGVWAPLDFVGTYGTNGFNLNFSDNTNTTAATLGADTSGNGNNWTPNNFSVSAGAGNDSLVDSPTPYGTDTGAGGEVPGNYCTLNPIANPNTPTYSITNGNLDYAATGGVGNATTQAAIATIGVTTNKWYYEGTVTSNNPGLGFSSELFLGSQRGTIRITYFSGSLANSAGITATGSPATFTNGDVIAVAYDADAGTATVYKNNVSQGTFSGIATGTALFPYVEPNTAAASSGVSFNFGQRPFAYTAPSGFKALNTQNLPTPTIGATSATLAGKYFNSVLWTSTGTTQSITGVGFQPDLTWLKSRNIVAGNYLNDAVRGASKFLISNSTNVEGTDAQFLTSFDSDGFSMGTSQFSNGNTFVTWNWKAGGTGVTNTSGSITSTISANPTSGFSIVSFNSTSATGTTATVGHGLGAVPSMIIMKNRTVGYNWEIYHISSTSTSGRLIFTTSAGLTDANPWNQSTQAVTSSIFGYNQTWNNGANDNIIAYCFAPIAGYSAFGSYTGNGSADGPFVHLGFRPAFLVVKNVSNTGNWNVHDSKRNQYNVVNNQLYVNITDAEFVAGSGNFQADFLSNGFKVRGSGSSGNTNADTYIYMAFAENPFKYSLAR